MIFTKLASSRSMLVRCVSTQQAPDAMTEYIVASDETFQSFSTFTSNHRSPAEYEDILVQASKQRATAVKAYGFRESYETGLVRSGLITTLQDC